MSLTGNGSTTLPSRSNSFLQHQIKMCFLLLFITTIFFTITLVTATQSTPYPNNLNQEVRFNFQPTTIRLLPSILVQNRDENSSKTPPATATLSFTISSNSHNIDLSYTLPFQPLHGPTGTDDIATYPWYYQGTFDDVGGMGQGSNGLQDDSVVLQPSLSRNQNSHSTQPSLPENPHPTQPSSTTPQSIVFLSIFGPRQGDLFGYVLKGGFKYEFGSVKALAANSGIYITPTAPSPSFSPSSPSFSPSPSSHSNNIDDNTIDFEALEQDGNGYITQKVQKAAVGRYDANNGTSHKNKKNIKINKNNKNNNNKSFTLNVPTIDSWQSSDALQQSQIHQNVDRILKSKFSTMSSNSTTVGKPPSVEENIEMLLPSQNDIIDTLFNSKYLEIALTGGRTTSYMDITEFATSNAIPFMTMGVDGVSQQDDNFSNIQVTSSFSTLSTSFASQSSSSSSLFKVLQSSAEEDVIDVDIPALTPEMIVVNTIPISSLSSSSSSSSPSLSPEDESEEISTESFLEPSQHHTTLQFNRFPNYYRYPNTRPRFNPSSPMNLQQIPDSNPLPGSATLLPYQLSSTLQKLPQCTSGVTTVKWVPVPLSIHKSLADMLKSSNIIATADMANTWTYLRAVSDAKFNLYNQITRHQISSNFYAWKHRSTLDTNDETSTNSSNGALSGYNSVDKYYVNLQIGTKGGVISAVQTVTNYSGIAMAIDFFRYMNYMAYRLIHTGFIAQSFASTQSNSVSASLYLSTAETSDLGLHSMRAPLPAPIAKININGVSVDPHKAGDVGFNADHYYNEFCTGVNRVLKTTLMGAMIVDYSNTLPICGDGVVQAPEECDNGDGSAGDTERCTSDCKFAPGFDCHHEDFCCKNGLLSPLQLVCGNSGTCLSTTNQCGIGICTQAQNAYYEAELVIKRDFPTYINATKLQEMACSFSCATSNSITNDKIQYAEVGSKCRYYIPGSYVDGTSTPKEYYGTCTRPNYDQNSDSSPSINPSFTGLICMGGYESPIAYNEVRGPIGTTIHYNYVPLNADMPQCDASGNSIMAWKCVRADTNEPVAEAFCTQNGATKPGTQFSCLLKCGPDVSQAACANNSGMCVPSGSPNSINKCTSDSSSTFVYRNPQCYINNQKVASTRCTPFINALNANGCSDTSECPLNIVYTYTGVSQIYNNIAPSNVQTSICQVEPFCGSQAVTITPICTIGGIVKDCASSEVVSANNNNNVQTQFTCENYLSCEWAKKCPNLLYSASNPSSTPNEPAVLDCADPKTMDCAALGTCHNAANKARTEACYGRSPTSNDPKAWFKYTPTQLPTVPSNCNGITGTSGDYTCPLVETGCTFAIKCKASAQSNTYQDCSDLSTSCPSCSNTDVTVTRSDNVVDKVIGCFNMGLQSFTTATTATELAGTKCNTNNSPPSTYNNLFSFLCRTGFESPRCAFNLTCLDTSVADPDANPRYVNCSTLTIEDQTKHYCPSLVDIDNLPPGDDPMNYCTAPAQLNMKCTFAGDETLFYTDFDDVVQYCSDAVAFSLTTLDINNNNNNNNNYQDKLTTTNKALYRTTPSIYNFATLTQAAIDERFTVICPSSYIECPCTRSLNQFKTTLNSGLDCSTLPHLSKLSLTTPLTSINYPLTPNSYNHDGNDYSIFYSEQFVTMTWKYEGRSTNKVKAYLHNIDTDSLTELYTVRVPSKTTPSQPISASSLSTRVYLPGLQGFYRILIVIDGLLVQQDLPSILDPTITAPTDYGFPGDHEALNTNYHVLPTTSFYLQNRCLNTPCQHKVSCQTYTNTCLVDHCYTMGCRNMFIPSDVLTTPGFSAEQPEITQPCVINPMTAQIDHCNCVEPYAGRYCTGSSHCEDSHCLNDGYVPYTNAACSQQAACTCHNHWTGNTCNYCGLHPQGLTTSQIDPTYSKEQGSSSGSVNDPHGLCGLNTVPDENCASCRCTFGHSRPFLPDQTPRPVYTTNTPRTETTGCTCYQAYGLMVFETTPGFLQPLTAHTVTKQAWFESLVNLLNTKVSSHFDLDRIKLHEYYTHSQLFKVRKQLRDFYSAKAMSVNGTIADNHNTNTNTTEPHILTNKFTPQELANPKFQIPTPEWDSADISQLYLVLSIDYCDPTELKFAAWDDLAALFTPPDDIFAGVDPSGPSDTPSPASIHENPQLKTMSTLQHKKWLNPSPPLNNHLKPQGAVDLDKYTGALARAGGIVYTLPLYLPECDPANYSKIVDDDDPADETTTTASLQGIHDHKIRILDDSIVLPSHCPQVQTTSVPTPQSSITTLDSTTPKPSISTAQDSTTPTVTTRAHINPTFAGMVQHGQPTGVETAPSTETPEEKGSKTNIPVVIIFSVTFGSVALALFCFLLSKISCKFCRQKKQKADLAKIERRKEQFLQEQRIQQMSETLARQSPDQQAKSPTPIGKQRQLQPQPQVVLASNDDSNRDLSYSSNSSYRG